jgi:choice-of-anchor B domain-containing protein
MTRIFITLVAALATSLFMTPVAADGDEHELVVATTGNDLGNCQSATSPCRTIPYALGKVGKNGRIHVAAGSFELFDVADVIYVLSAAIDVRANPAPGLTSTLVGVPPEFAGELAAKGFHVIVDSKGTHQTAVDTRQSIRSNAPASSCVSGLAGVFPCDNADLLVHIADRTSDASGADVWGFMDLNSHREYAIVGYSSGTAVYDVTNTENAREVGFIAGTSTTWRDIKVHQFWNVADNRWNAYAYVTADNVSDGLTIIDLSQLPHSVQRISYASDFAAAHNVFLTATDFSTGLSLTGESPSLILAGSSQSDGRFRTYSLVNPAAPSFIATPATPVDQPVGDRLYMHDGASMLVTDARKGTQCVNAAGSEHCHVLFDFNESSVDIWDVTLPNDPVRLSRLPYNNSRYTHSGWPSEDRQFLFVQDELDERDLGLPTTLRSYSIADLTAPTFAGSWTGPTNAIDHNGFVRGNRYYMSNYARGLSILDVSNAALPALVGRFDTFPSSDGVGFPGNWGVYPFLPSGHIALSDIDTGFYLLADNTLNVDQGSFSFAAEAFGADETQPVTIVVQRNGGSLGAVSVDWELIAANGSFDDIASSNGTLSWNTGDASDRTISLGLTNDGITEGLERILVKLVAPTGGATLSSPAIASAYISDPGDPSVVAFTETIISISESGFQTAVAVVHRTGSASGALSINYSVSSGNATNGTDYTGPTSGTLAWTDGDANPKWIEYSIVDDGPGEDNEFLELTLSNISSGSIGANGLLRINIIDDTKVADPPATSGGGSIGFWLLLCLGGLAVASRKDVF